MHHLQTAINILISILITLGFLSLSSCGQNKHPPYPSYLFNVDLDDLAIFSPCLASSEQQILNQLSDATVYHMNLELTDDLSILNGSEEILYTNQGDTPLNEIYLSYFPLLLGDLVNIVQIAVENQVIMTELKFNRQYLRIPLIQDLKPGEKNSCNRLCHTEA